MVPVLVPVLVCRATGVVGMLILVGFGLWDLARCLSLLTSAVGLILLGKGDPPA